MKRTTDNIRFHEQEVLNSPSDIGDEYAFELFKELDDVYAAISLYRAPHCEDEASVLIVDYVDYEWNKTFYGDDALTNAVNYANRVLLEEVDYLIY